jgi:hypothetical protein
MLLRPNHRSKDGKGHTYWSLVETVRPQGKGEGHPEAILPRMEDALQRLQKTILAGRQENAWRHEIAGGFDSRR